jgi:hypothetical protein
MLWLIALVASSLLLSFTACSSRTLPPSHQGISTQAASVGNGTFDHRAFDRLLASSVNEDGWVDYAGLERDRAALDAYLATLASAAPQSFSSDAERLAFWINAYNSFTLSDALSDVYHKAKGVKEVSGFFDQKRHRVAGQDFTLDEIEKRGRDFHDSRIHFAINCASASCPKLRPFAYTGAELDAQLNRVAREFLMDPARGLRLDRQRNEIYLSSIFKWYAGDFTGASSGAGRALAFAKAAVSGGAVLNYVKKFAPADVAQYIEQNHPSVAYLDYDWSLNAQHAKTR